MIRTAACPKRMVHGPCGGVDTHGRCELGHLPCPFVPGPLARPATTADPVPLGLSRRPLLLADVPALACDLDSTRRAAAALAPWADAGLTGDHADARVQLPPVLRAQALAGEGLPAWVGLNCRDRNRVALEGEVAGLAALGVAAVHCVTGDHTHLGHRPDAAAVFDLDSTALAARAAATGLTASVAENPLAPPTAARPGRLAAKVAAGAAACIVNHVGRAEVVGTFVSEARAAGAVDTVFLACVPVVISATSAQRLARFTSLATPPGLLGNVEGSPDPYRRGVSAAIAFAQELLGQPGLDGVDLSGVAGPGEEQVLAEAMAEVARALR